MHKDDDERPIGHSNTLVQKRRESICNLSFRDDAFDLLVIDTAVSFLPLAERNARLRRWAIAQLGFVASFPTGVLLLNQSRTMHRPLAAYADIVIDMAIPRGLGMTRRRTFTAVGRYPETLQSASAELNAEGTDYLLLGDSPAPHPPLLGTLQTLLGDSTVPLSRRELLERWPGPAPRPDTLWRTLTRGVEVGLFLVSGSGTKTDPLRYGVTKQTNPADPGVGQAACP
jgi:hypothetical protein